MKVDRMRKEHDFTDGIRGRFHRDNSTLNLPVYLDRDALAFVQGIALKKKLDISTVVNELIRSDMRIAALVAPQTGKS